MVQIFRKNISFHSFPPHQEKVLSSKCGVPNFLNKSIKKNRPKKYRRFSHNSSPNVAKIYLRTSIFAKPNFNLSHRLFDTTY